MMSVRLNLDQLRAALLRAEADIHENLVVTLRDGDGIVSMQLSHSYYGLHASYAIGHDGDTVKL